jgi:hypothetical protein
MSGFGGRGGGRGGFGGASPRGRGGFGGDRGGRGTFPFARQCHTGGRQTLTMCMWICFHFVVMLPEQAVPVAALAVTVVVGAVGAAAAEGHLVAVVVHGVVAGAV